MKVRARINNYRSSARKARLIAPVIKGLGAVEAQVQLEHLRKGCAEDVKKLIASAVANAENNHELSKEELVVSEYVVEEGRTMKRWRPRAHGRAAQILKRTCNIIVGLEEKKEDVKKETKNTAVKKQAKTSAGKKEGVKKNSVAKDKKQADKKEGKQPEEKTGRDNK